VTVSNETVKTNIWREEPELDNPFAARQCYCAGYDVYGDLLGKVSWVQYLYLLFKLELPTPEQARLLENLAVAIANPGIRDHSVRAAMNAGVGGSTRGSALIAAITVGAGNLNGGREVLQMMRWWQSHGTDLASWQQAMTSPNGDNQPDVWHPMEHIPGFDPNGETCALPVLQTLKLLSTSGLSNRLQWLADNRQALEKTAGYPLAMSGVIATAFCDLEFDEGQAEILYLLLRLPGAAAHALEQEKQGWAKYPFFSSSIQHVPENEYQTLLESLGITR
jgi:citrate synthase